MIIDIFLLEGWPAEMLWPSFFFNAGAPDSKNLRNFTKIE